MENYHSSSSQETSSQIKWAKFIDFNRLTKINFIALLLQLLIFTVPNRASNFTVEELLLLLSTRSPNSNQYTYEEGESTAPTLGDWVNLARQLGVEFPEEVDPVFNNAFQTLTNGEPLMWRHRDGSLESNIFDDFLNAELSGQGINFLIEKYEISSEQALAVIFADFAHTFQITSEEDHRILSFIINNIVWHENLESLQEACGRGAGACVTYEGKVHLLRDISIGTIAHELVHAFLQFLQAYNDPNAELTTTVFEGAELVSWGSGLPWPAVVVRHEGETESGITLETLGGVEVEAVILSVLYLSDLPGANSSHIRALNWDTISYFNEMPRWQTMRSIVANFPASRREAYFEASRNNDLLEMLKLLGEAISEAELNALIEELRTSTDPRILNNPVLQDLLHEKIPQIDAVIEGRTDRVQGLFLFGILSGFVSEQYSEGMGYLPNGYERVLVDYDTDGSARYSILGAGDYALYEARGETQHIGANIESIADTNRRLFYEYLEVGLPMVFGPNVYERLADLNLNSLANQIVFSSEFSDEQLAELRLSYPNMIVIDVTDENWKFNALQQFFAGRRIESTEYGAPINYVVTRMEDNYFVFNSYSQHYHSSINIGIFDQEGNLSLRGYNTTSANYIISSLLADSLLQATANNEGITYDFLSSRTDFFTPNFDAAKYNQAVDAIATSINPDLNMALFQDFSLHRDDRMVMALTALIEANGPLDAENHITNSLIVQSHVFTENQQLVLGWLNSANNNWTSGTLGARWAPRDFLNWSNSFTISQTDYLTYLDGTFPDYSSFAHFLGLNEAVEIWVWGAG